MIQGCPALDIHGRRGDQEGSRGTFKESAAGYDIVRPGRGKPKQKKQQAGKGYRIGYSPALVPKKRVMLHKISD